MSILEYSFFQNALIGSLLASIVCGIIGTYIVSRRLVFISGGITHASFGGIGLGVFFGINPILSAMVYAVLSAFGVQWMSHHVKVREDSAIALFWTFGMSIGILCSFLTPGFMPDLPSFLIAVTIVSTLRLVGIVLAISLLTVPQMTANLFTYSFRRIIFLSIAIGWVDCLAGLFISYWFNVPSGASIIFASIIIYALLRTIKAVVFKFK